MALYPYPLSTALAAFMEGLPETYHPRSWLEYMHPDYRAKIMQWTYARDHYTGDVLTPQKIAHYLVQKYLGETPEAFIERVSLCDYTPHFSTIVDSLAGMMFQSEADATVVYGNLGSPEDMNTPMGRLALDADGKGNGWDTLWRVVAMNLTAIHTVWGFVDGGTPGAPKVKVLHAEDLPNWRYKDGVLVEAMLSEVVDERASIEDDVKGEQPIQYIRFTLDGWQRYKQVEEKTGGVDGAVRYRAEALQGPGTSGSYIYYDQNNQRALPIFKQELSLQRPVGYMLARKQNAMFNLESTRDAGLRSANFPLINVIGNDAIYKKVTDMLKQGARALPNMPGQGAGHQFIAPSGEPARVATLVLEEKVKMFWRSGFREYGDAANRKTAEEVRQDVAQGVGAFLGLLRIAVDDFQNQIFWRLEQTLFPNERAKWFNARITRSDDFLPFDVNWTIERLRNRYFGTASIVPLGRSAKIEAARQIAEWDGLEATDQEIAAAVDVQMLQASLALTDTLPMPAEARADAAVRFLLDSGYLAQPKLKADGTSDDASKGTPDIATLRAAALKIAKETEEKMITALAAGQGPTGGKDKPAVNSKPPADMGPPPPTGLGVR